jgi:hypothetical protein
MKEALKLALEALETAKKAMSLDRQTTHDRHTDRRLYEAVQSLQNYIHGCRNVEMRNETIPRLSQPAQEPDKLTIAYMSEFYNGKKKRPWIGLTEAQFLEAARLAESGNYLVAFQRIQQWLQELNT